MSEAFPRPIVTGIGHAQFQETLPEGAMMNNETNRHVVPNTDRGWDVVAPHAQRASAHTDTQAQAIDRAREIVSNAGGGEVRIHNREGVIRDTDTIASATTRTHRKTASRPANRLLVLVGRLPAPSAHRGELIHPVLLQYAPPVAGNLCPRPPGQSLLLKSLTPQERHGSTVDDEVLEQSQLIIPGIIVGRPRKVRHAIEPLPLIHAQTR